MGVLSLYSMSGDASGKPTPSFFFSLREIFFGGKKKSFLFLLFFSMFVFGDGIAAFFLFLLVVGGSDIGGLVLRCPPST